MNQTNGHRGGLAPQKYLTPEELDALIEYTRARAKKRKSARAKIDYLCVHILAGAGLRASELCALTLQDLPCRHNKPVIYVRDGKGNVSGAVDISTKLSSHIKKFVDEYRADAEQTAPLVLGNRGRPIAYITIYGKIRRLGEEMKTPGGLHPHKIRHSFAVKLYARENDILFVSQQLRHASIQTTQIYAKTTTEAAKRQMEGF